MPTECERLIAETLRLDAEATKGPWNYIEGDGSVWNDDDMGRCVANTDHCANMNMDINAALIASYRTAAPRLARMLRAAIAGLTVVRDRIGITDQQDASCADATLAEIERIAKEETDGSQR